jgi:N-acetylglutamate synthase-like GNAT family acetyltransferase
LGVNCEYWCVENDGITQGIVLLITSECYSKIDSELPIININYIGVAPWNRKKNKAIGTKLCKFAISRCVELKYGGIGAYAVYDSEGFFRKIGFNYIEHQTYQGLRYMEYQIISHR